MVSAKDGIYNSGNGQYLIEGDGTKDFTQVDKSPLRSAWSVFSLFTHTTTETFRSKLTRVTSIDTTLSNLLFA